MSTKLDHECRPADGDRLLNNVHLRDCNTSGCPGCMPCRPEHGHCHQCGIVHLDAQHPRTCPSCRGKVRNDILELVDQTVEAYAQRSRRSINSVAFMVGTRAVGDYEAHSYVHHSAMSGRLCKCARRGVVCPAEQPIHLGPVCKRHCPHESCMEVRRSHTCPDAAFIFDEARIDERHPVTVLAGWDSTWRRVLGHDPDVDKQGDNAPVTLKSTSSYLLRNLPYMAQQPEEISDFTQFAADLTEARTWLADVLRLGYRPDRAGTCPVCGKEKLVKDWDDRNEGTAYDPARDAQEYVDQWICPNPDCNQVYLPGEYREKLDVMWVEDADRLPAVELATRLRVPQSTIRRWAGTKKKLITPVRVIDGVLVDAVWQITPPVLKSCGLHTDGRKLYRVKDAEALRDNRGKVAS